VSIKGIGADRERFETSGTVAAGTGLVEIHEAEPRALIFFDDMPTLLERVGGNALSLRNPYSVEISLPVSDAALLTPRRAIRDEGQMDYVYILQDGIRKKRYVLTGMYDQDTIQILGGIEEGDLVILS
jgi:hypothetical protein